MNQSCNTCKHSRTIYELKNRDSKIVEYECMIIGIKISAKEKPFECDYYTENKYEIYEKIN